MFTWLSARQLTVVCEQEDEVGLGRCSRHDGDGHSGHEEANESHLRAWGLICSFEIADSDNDGISEY